MPAFEQTTGVLPRPAVSAEPTLLNMLGSVITGSGLQRRGEVARSVRRFPNHPTRRPYLKLYYQQGSEPEIEGPRGDPNTSAKPFGSVRSMTDSTSMANTPPGTGTGDKPTINQKPTSPPSSNTGAEAQETPNTAPATTNTTSKFNPAGPSTRPTPPIGPDATGVKSMAGVITAAPDSSQAAQESHRPSTTENLSPSSVETKVQESPRPSTTENLPPNRVKSMVQESPRPSTTENLPPNWVETIVQESPRPSTTENLPPNRVETIVQESPRPSTTENLPPNRVENVTYQQTPTSGSNPTSTWTDSEGNTYSTEGATFHRTPTSGGPPPTSTWTDRDGNTYSTEGATYQQTPTSSGGPPPTSTWTDRDPYSTEGGTTSTRTEPVDFASTDSPYALDREGVTSTTTSKASTVTPATIVQVDERDGITSTSTSNKMIDYAATGVPSLRDGYGGQVNMDGETTGGGGPRTTCDTPAGTVSATVVVAESGVNWSPNGPTEDGTPKAHTASATNGPTEDGTPKADTASATANGPTEDGTPKAHTASATANGPTEDGTPKAHTASATLRTYLQGQYPYVPIDMGETTGGGGPSTTCDTPAGTLSATIGVASPDSMYSLNIPTETGTTTSAPPSGIATGSEIRGATVISTNQSTTPWMEPGGTVGTVGSTVVATTAFSTPAARGADVGAVQTSADGVGMGLGGAMGAILGGMLLMKAFGGSKKA